MLIPKEITTKVSSRLRERVLVGLAKLSAVQPGCFFLAVAVPVCLFLCIFTPPFQVPDEQAHFARAYQVSEGGFLPDHISQNGVGGRLPASIMALPLALVGDIPGHPNQKISIDIIFAQFALPLAPEKRVDIHFENTALYSPLMYAPSALGIDIVKMFGAPPMVMFYVGRLFTMLAFIGVVYLAIRLVPIGKWAFAVVALAPMALFQAASLSADALTLAASFMVTAWFVRLVMQKAPVSSKDWALTVGLLLILGFVKQPYALLGLLFVAVPAKQFMFKKIRWQFIGSIVAALGVGVVSMYMVSKGYFAQSPFMVDRILQPDAQLAHVLSQPFQFLKVLFLSHVTSFSDANIPQMVGVFGWLDTPLPMWVVLMYLGCVVVAIGQTYKEKILPRIQRFALVIATVGIILAIDLLLYLYWNILYAGVVGGMQGRYYLMILPAVVLVFSGYFTVTFKKITPSLVIMAGMLVVILVSLITIFDRFYR